MDGPQGDLGRCGEHTLLRRIGVGGMGEIFLASSAEGRKVAIKRLLPECARDPVFIGMFLDEARLVKRLQHPNVCEVYGHGQEGQHYYLVMEYIDGVSLKDLLERREHRGLPFPLAGRIIAEVASGLDYAHRLKDELGVPMGIVHRDVSPANIMIARDGAVKIVDFGLAKAATQLMKTQPGLVKGKFGYLAPEQLGGQVDWRTDLFALGLCLFEALTGRQLFNQRTAAQTVQAIKSFQGPPALVGRIEGVPTAIDQVLATALAPQPADRFESAAALRLALGRAVVAGGHPAVSPAALAAVVAQSASRRPPPPDLQKSAELDTQEALEALGKGEPPWAIIGIVAAVVVIGVVILIAVLSS